jgi:hypothetical protein
MDDIDEKTVLETSKFVEVTPDFSVVLSNAYGTDVLDPFNLSRMVAHASYLTETEEGKAEVGEELVSSWRKFLTTLKEAEAASQEARVKRNRENKNS